MRMVMLTCFMSWELCSIAPDVPGTSNSYRPKRGLDAPDGQVPKKQACASATSEPQLHDSQIIVPQSSSNLTQPFLASDTCELCDFKHSFENVSQIKPMRIHEFSLIQLTNHPRDNIKLNKYFCLPRHPICASLKFLVYGKFYADLCKGTFLPPRNKACVLIKLSLDDIGWFAFIIKRVSNFQNVLDRTNKPIININCQPKCSSSELDADLLNEYMNSVLLSIIKFHIEKYFHTLQYLDVPICESEVKPLLKNQFESEFDFKMCQEMLKNPFAFYMHVYENMKKIRKLNNLDMENKDNLTNVKKILSAIDLELENIYNEENGDNFETNTLKLSLIIYTYQTQPLKIITKIKSCADMTLNNLITYFNIKPDNFQHLIYKLGTKEQIWVYGCTPHQIHGRTKSIQKFINFIELYTSGRRNRMKLNFKKVILFYIAKVVLCKGMIFVSTLCYILYKMDLMSEFSFYIMFRHSFIIKSLISRTSENFTYAWFEINDKGKSKLRNIIKPIRLDTYETFCTKWEEQQQGNLVQKIKELKFFGETNVGTEKSI